MRIFDSLPLFMMGIVMISCNGSQFIPGPSGGTKLEGNNAAIGGVNLHNTAEGSSKSWDKHIDSCHLDKIKQELMFAAGGAETLRVPLDQQQRQVIVVNSPAGSISFAAQECSVYKLEATPSQSSSRNGKVSLVCDHGQQELTATARFERCTS